MILTTISSLNGQRILSSSHFADQLRKERNEIWLKCAQMAQTNFESSETTCFKWSQAADHLLSKAFHHCFSNQNVALFALGKLGSHELNLSSDVDVLLITSNDSPLSPTQLRKFNTLLSEHTNSGFVFRVDFDLRPGGTHGPLAPTVDQFKDYYGNYGETWERLALVRLRPICGDAHIQSEIVAFAKKFCFRRHLDFTLLEDLKNLRAKIQNHQEVKFQKNSIHLKLAVGGIRDVELFTHALLVIHGGKDLDLQVRETSKALQLLEEKKLLPAEEATFLREHYWRLRTLENYTQSLHDEQTHLIDPNGTHPKFIQELLQTTVNDMKHCEFAVRSLLGKPPSEKSLEEELKYVGLSEEALKDLWNEILGKEVLSRNKARDEVARKSFILSFLNSLKEQKGDVRRGLLLLKDFIQGTRAKASFFTLLEREPELLKKMTWLFGHSPYLARILCNRPELLDSFVFRSQQKHSEDLGTLLEELAEKRLLTEVIGGSDFLEDRSLNNLHRNLTATADALTETLLEALRREFSSSIKILALGKWGGRELGFRSDLDFIFVVDQEPHETDFKVAKRFVTRLTESHRGGNIYSVDMRLRPSGKAGPLVITDSHLREYLRNNAEAWERQAYLKARWVHLESSALQSEFIHRGLSSEDILQLNQIRQQLTVNSPSINLKYSAGALIDIELALQTSWLEKKSLPSSTHTMDFFSIWGSAAEPLSENYSRLRQIEQTLQLVASESLLELRPNHESFQALALVLHLEPKKLLEEIQEILTQNIEILKELDPRRRAY